jgi:hypothetical protein
MITVGSGCKGVGGLVILSIKVGFFFWRDLAGLLVL